MSDLSDRRVLVTGGSGFIGRSVVRTLQERGADVVVADLKPFPDAAVDTVVGDLCDPTVRERAVTEGLFGIVHLAALPSVLKSIEAPWEVYLTNTEMTSGLLERARNAGVDRFVFASTNAVVGDVGRTRIVEDMVLRPLTPYGATKAAAEMLLTAYGASYGMSTCSLRLSNVFGPGMGHKDSMVPRLMRVALTDGEAQIYGDGEQVRDFVNVIDVAQAFTLALSEGWDRPVIVGSGRSYSVNELVEMTREVTGHPVPARNVDPKPGEMPAVLVDVSRAASQGWKPEVAMTDGLQQTWDYFQDQSRQGLLEPAG